MANLELLLAREDDGKPALANGLPFDSAGARSPDRVEVLKKRGGDPNLVEREGWGVVVPEGERGQHLWDLIARLRAARGGDAVRRYEAKPGLGLAESAAWRDLVYTPADAGAADPPRYLLILGDAHEISWDLQACLQGRALVGRLAFADDAGYESYVDKLLKAERREAAAARALFYGVRDGSSPTTIGCESLVLPSIAACKSRNSVRLFPANALAELPRADLGAADLLRAAAGEDPAVLFSLSHGCGAPRQGWKRPEDQRALQGAMMLDEPGDKLVADDVRDASFLPDGVWFYFACFGAGTPSVSAYEPWLRDLAAAKLVAPQNLSQSSLPRAGERPFVAALPQAALANPRGPLAVMAHVDLAWVYAFQRSFGARQAPFQRVVEALVQGQRAGVAFRALLDELRAADSDLAAMYQTQAAGAAPVEDAVTARAELWMRRLDLANYVLLGDPAARLPIPRFDVAGAKLPAPFERPTITRPTAPIVAGGAARKEPSRALPTMPPPAPVKAPNSGPARAAGAPKERRRLTFDPVPLQVGVLWAPFEDLDEAVAACTEKGIFTAPFPAIDALGIGHYADTTSPSGSELALDVKLSLALGAPSAPDKRPPRPPGRERIITGYARRGFLPERLGQSFFLPDPRAPGRVIALAAMGRPNQFGVSEITLLARELCWSLGRMGKKHLATLVIGAGASSVHSDEAVQAWMRGVRTALTELEQAQRWHLDRITFVEFEPTRVTRIRELLVDIAAKEAKRTPEQPRLLLTIMETPESSVRSRDDTLTLAEAKRRIAVGEAWPDPYSTTYRPVGQPVPARILVEREGKRLRFGAITETASTPDRYIGVDPALIEEANARLARFEGSDRQLTWARYMGRLVFPSDIVDMLASTDPLVMMVDASSARIQWEMLVPPPAPMSATLRRDPLGLVRGVSRQLRTAFAPPPEPPPPARRLLRVLIVVSDPRGDLPLAQQEGRALFELFEAFNTQHQHPDYRVDVKLLAGRDARLNDVLFELISGGPFDILHYAGHCFYDPEDPRSAGWIFENGMVLSVQELSRVERIPRFVFANACQSGVTPDRSADTDLGLGPTFAEAFFERGVANFVCTAWPVHDDPALDFALELYAGLLGLLVTRAGSTYKYEAAEPLAMHEALLAARQRVHDQVVHSQRDGASIACTQTWGAYQHYGAPYLRLFDPDNKFGDRKDSPVSEYSESSPPTGSPAFASDGPNAGGDPAPAREEAAGAPDLPPHVAAMRVDGSTMVSD